MLVDISSATFGTLPYVAPTGWFAVVPLMIFLCLCISNASRSAVVSKSKGTTTFVRFPIARTRVVKSASCTPTTRKMIREPCERQDFRLPSKCGKKVNNNCSNKNNRRGHSRDRLQFPWKFKWMSSSYCAILTINRNQSKLVCSATTKTTRQPRG